MTKSEAMKHLRFNVKHNGGGAAQADAEWGWARRTLVDEGRGVYLAVDVSRLDGRIFYSADIETGVVILGGGCDRGRCFEGRKLSEIAGPMSAFLTEVGL